MFSCGLLDEITSILSFGVDKNCQCMQAIGYKEVFDYLEGKASLEQVKELIKLNTRHYAKRQITFFKKLNVVALEPSDTGSLAKKIVKDLQV